MKTKNIKIVRNTKLAAEILADMLIAGIAINIVIACK